MLRDDYVHVCDDGLTSDKGEWIDHATEVPRMPERVDMPVRVHDDTAVLTGKMITRIRPNENAQPSDTIGNCVRFR